METQIKAIIRDLHHIRKMIHQMHPKIPFQSDERMMARARRFGIQPPEYSVSADRFKQLLDTEFESERYAISVERFKELLDIELDHIYVTSF